MKQSLKKDRRAQTILELVFVVMTLVSIFGLSFFLISLFDISQKQTMLARTQAFMELGNFADYGFSKHGEDQADSENSQVIFVLGENNPGTRVDLAGISAFKEMVQGELEINVSNSINDDPAWSQFRFPRRITRLFIREDNEDLLNIPLEQTLAIAHSRSIKLDEDIGDANDTGQFSGSIHYMQVQELNRVMAENGFTGEGLVDNVAAIQSVLREIAKEDPSLSDAALKAQGDANLLHGIEGGAQAALISLALQMALQYGFQQLSSAFNEIAPEAANAGSQAANGAGGITGSAAGAGGAVAGGAGGGFNFGFPSIALKEGANLYNFGQVMTFSSQVLNTVNLGAALAGKNIEGLGVASAITGGLGGVAGGISSLQTFQSAGGFSGQGLGTDFFGGLQQISGGAGSIAGLVDPNAATAFGIASTGFGLGSSISNLGQNWGSWSGSEGGLFKQFSGVGAVASQAGGLVGSLAPGSGIAQGLSLAGSGLGTVGGIGSFSLDLQAGNFANKPFETMAMTGGLIASASSVGASLAQMTGNESMAETFSYGMIGGGALALAGTAGIMGKAAIEGIGKVGEKISSLGKSEGATIEGPDFNEAPATAKTSFEKVNEALQFASVANQYASAGLSAALTAKGASGFQSDVADAPTTGLASAGQIAKALDSIDLASVTKQMNESQATRFNEYVATYQNSLAHVDDRTSKGALPDHQIVQNGYTAARNAQALLDAQQNLPAEGSSQRLALQQQEYQKNMQTIAAADQGYQDLFQQDSHVLSLMLQSERDVDGKIVVANEERRDLLEDLGEDYADQIAEHREKYYKDDSFYSNRLKKAEHSWRNMNFSTPRDALDQVQISMGEYEDMFKSTKSALVNQLQACRSVAGC